MEERYADALIGLQSLSYVQAWEGEKERQRERRCWEGEKNQD
jgi:hypothetical protein